MLAAVLLASGCGTGGIASTHTDQANGAKVFASTCAACHTLAAANATGTIGPNLDHAFAADKAQGFAESTIQNVVLDQIRLGSGSVENGNQPGTPMPSNLVKGHDAQDVAAYVAAVAGQGGPATGASSGQARTAAAKQAAPVQISTKKLPGLGTVLVNGTGRTLYMFVPDRRSKVTCVGSCAALWPPVKLAKGQKPVASGGAKASLLGSDPDPAGGRVATYAGWPLYTYVADASPGSAKGQALKLTGGLWYVLAPSGTVIHKKP